MLRYSPRIRQNRSLLHPGDLGQDTISVHDFPGIRRVMHSEVSWQMEFDILYCNRDNPIFTFVPDATTHNTLTNRDIYSN